MEIQTHNMQKKIHLNLYESPEIHHKNTISTKKINIQIEFT